jgi:DNA polymerase eta
VKKIRDAVQNELGYSISAGIASNKLLAKIGSSKNKPRKQTIIPHRHGPAVLANLPVKGVSPPFPL